MATGIGQLIYKVFTLVNPTVGSGFPTCEDNKYDCPYDIPVITDGTTDEFKNDKSDVFKFSALWTTGIVYTIQKLLTEPDTYEDKSVFSTSYGENFPMGTYPAIPKYSSILIYWTLVYGAWGLGKYRIKIEESTPAGTLTSYSKPYCLRLWSCHLHNSVRLEGFINKGIGDIDNDKNILNFSTSNHYMQLRLDKSIFGYPTSTYEVEEIQYPNGQIENVADNQEEKYTLLIGGTYGTGVPAWVHNMIKTYYLQADKLLITDYGKNNPQEIVKKEVKRTSAYEPKWTKAHKCATVSVEFKPVYNRLERFRCV